MKTKFELYSALKVTASIILLSSAVSLTSCSYHTCSAYARSKDRLNYVQSQKKVTKGSQNIPSPFTAQYKDKMYRKTF